MADTKETKETPTASPEMRGKLVREETRRARSEQDDEDPPPRRRRRRRRVLFRGSLLEGVYQATLESFVAASDAFRSTVNSFVDRDREDRDRRGGRLGGVVSNCVDTGWDAYDNFVDIPRRSWNAYRDEIDRDDDDDDDDRNGKQKK